MMSTMRGIKSVHKSIPTMEGAGVRLRRAFGYHHVPQLDPFLLLDDFHSENPDDYIKGFPWHPHRGIETITYILDGKVEHGDSMGNQGVIGPGDVQWMTAGSGIVHQEMPKGRRGGTMWGFQLWANLPASHKMMAPRYRDILSSQIPETTLEGGVKVKVICGKVGEVEGPVRDIVTSPEYLDVSVPAKSRFSRSYKSSHNVFAYVIDGNGVFGEPDNTPIGKENLIIFTDGDRIALTTTNESIRFLLVSGKPIREPVAWYGPIVMNTEEELRTAFEEYRKGTFIKYRK